MEISRSQFKCVSKGVKVILVQNCGRERTETLRVFFAFCCENLGSGKCASKQIVQI